MLYVIYYTLDGNTKQRDVRVFYYNRCLVQHVEHLEVDHDLGTGHLLVLARVQYGIKDAIGDQL